ncbi:MAG: hypothetical protein ABR961_03330 [Thermoanaerobaculaceae bacterium]|jgi:hypothetical protein
MGDIDLFDDTAVLNLVGTQTVTATDRGSAVNVHQGNLEARGVAILDAAAASAGTTPTLDVKLVESDDGVTWTDVPGAAFSEVSASPLQQAIPVAIDSRKQFVAAAYTLGASGTSTPSFTFSVNLIGLKKYR